MYRNENKFKKTKFWVLILKPGISCSHVFNLQLPCNSGLSDRRGKLLFLLICSFSKWEMHSLLHSEGYSAGRVWGIGNPSLKMTISQSPQASPCSVCYCWGSHKSKDQRKASFTISWALGNVKMLCSGQRQVNHSFLFPIGLDP